MLAINQTLGYEYMLVMEPASWPGALQGCVSRGYNLASIQSSDEHIYIHTAIQASEGQS